MDALIRNICWPHNLKEENNIYNKILNFGDIKLLHIFR